MNVLLRRAPVLLARRPLLPLLSTCSSLSYSARPLPTLLSGGETHDDFKPKLKAAANVAAGGAGVSEQDKALKMIESHVTGNLVMLYMKGSPSHPQCGFSAKVVRILQGHSVDFSSVDVLSYPAIREAVKTYGQWPTIPQLYVRGEFVGGCDIVQEMDASGDLKTMLAGIKDMQQAKK